jgi:predicted dehydrogenase
MGLNSPVEVALIGAGNRSQKVYRPLFQALRPWMRLVAVCDPVREHADALAASLGVPAFYSIQELVAARPMEAALVVAPIDAHHAISCYLSQHQIHNHIETSMSSLLVQARQMAQQARDNGVVVSVAENFFRFPFDRIAKQIDQTGFLGPIKRLTSFHDHTGYHNNSRWIMFYGAHPTAAQAVAHTMPTAPHYESPHRFHQEERYRAHFFFFPEDRLVVDMAGNIKGMLGRSPRPGYTELDGARGTIVQQATQHWEAEAEVRYCSDAALQDGGRADQVFPIVQDNVDGRWVRTYVDLPDGRVEYANPYPAEHNQYTTRPFYSAAVMDHLVDFARAVREGATSAYTLADAVMAMEMEVATRESALRSGARLELPLAGDLESEEQSRTELRAKHRVDPLDIEAMLAISYPQP